jgi:hypothetical protein
LNRVAATSKIKAGEAKASLQSARLRLTESFHEWSTVFLPPSQNKESIKLLAFLYRSSLGAAASLCCRASLWCEQHWLLIVVISSN